MGELFAPLPDRKYSIILADPPWRYFGSNFTVKIVDGKRINPNTGSAESHYSTVSLREIGALPVSTIANKSCLLFMWVPSSLIPQALWLGRRWGFEFSTVAFVWDKMTTNPGNYVMLQCEFVLLFRKGTIPKPRGSVSERQLIRVRKSSHSTKPQAVHHRIDRMFPTQFKIELFAREPVGIPRWHTWGNEV